MNISLPENMRSWVERQIATEGYGTASEYFRALIRSEQARRAREDLDHKLIDSIESGDAVEMTAKDWNMIRATVRERLAAARARR